MIKQKLLQDGLVGDVFYGPAAEKHKAILLLGGSKGGKAWSRVRTPIRLLVERGYALLSLAYFKAPGLSDSLQEVPLEILSKPKPVYTDEARRLQIEGEVLLEAVFTAAGKVRVLRILQGLGHGLDFAARSAAEAIVFRPARNDGNPVDATVIVRIQFQLAY